MKLYKANRKGFLKYVVLLTAVIGTGIFLDSLLDFSENPFLFLLLISPIGLLLWIYFDTYYQLDHNTLKYKSGFIKGRIDVSQIREIRIGVTHWVGLKPALAKNGLLICYNKYDEIYIAPEDNHDLVADLLSVNGKIMVK